MDRPKLVVRYAKENKMTKGFSSDFNQNKDSFNVEPVDVPGKLVPVVVKDLKAVFFVRDFAGNSEYKERKEFTDGEQPLGKKIEVSFNDGEVMVGTTMYYDKNLLGFFLFPVDLQSNNIRIFVVNNSVKNVKFL